MNKTISHLDSSHFSQGCAFWNSHDDWFLQRDQIKVHQYAGSLRIMDIANAMKPGQTCEEFCFNWNRDAFPNGVDRLFRQHDYNLRAVFDALRALPWQCRKHWRTGEPQAGFQEFKSAELISILPPFQDAFNAGCQAVVALFRESRRAARVWSPFARVNPLPAQPAKWTIPHVVRALLCGQFTNLKCNGVYSDDYAYDAAVNFHQGEIKNATAFARRIMESPSGWWASESNGEVSICCHSFDSNSFRFELKPAARSGASAKRRIAPPVEKLAPVCRPAATPCPAPDCGQLARLALAQAWAGN